MNQQPSDQNLIASEAQVTKRIDELATEIIQRYKGKNPLFVCLLRGGAPFAMRLMFAITAKDPEFHPELDYLTIKTYGDERVNKAPELLADLHPSTKPAGRLVVVIDDVLDKGVTAEFAHHYMTEHHKAVGADLVVLIEKDRERQAYPHAALSGFNAPNEWLTGMGLDDPRVAKEANRWASYVTQVSD